MQKEIKEIIEKHLPAQVGEVLNARLKQAEEDAGKVVQQAELLKDNQLQITQLESKLAQYEKFDVRNALLESKEKLLAEGELNLKVTTLEFQLKSEQEKTLFTKEVALGLVRNTEFRRSLFDNQSEPYKDQYGITQYQNKTQNSNETNTAS